MTSSGRQLAFFVAILIAFALPKRVELGNPVRHGNEVCTASKLEPWGFYLIGNALGREVGFAYSHDDDCR